MSDAAESTPDSDLVQEDIAKIAAFFDRVNAKVECPICAAKRWEVISKDAAILVHADKHRNWLPKLQVPALAVACLNCGFIRLHSSAIMERQTADAPSEESPT